MNFDFSEIPAAAIEDMIRHVAEATPQAIIVFCTDMDGASLDPVETGFDPLPEARPARLWHPDCVA